MINKRVLLVEDNKEIMHGNKRLFELEGYEVSCALTLAEARGLIDGRRPDIIVLDIMMPDGNGLDFMRELREGENSGVPILLLTGLTTKEDVLRGLKSGGDDYLTKPYDFDILLTRVETLLRRVSNIPEIIENGSLKLDVLAGLAFINGGDLLLAQKEFSLLLLFVQNEDKTMSAEYLYEKVWKMTLNDNTNALKNTISRLRNKIFDSGYTISAVRGEGYVFKRE